VNTSECNSWGGETDLDISMIHTLAPGAKILIIATPVSETQGLTGFPEMMTAMDYTVANKLASVISMSLGTAEDDFSTSAELHNLDSHFKNATDNGVTVLASSGDDGADGRKVDNTTYWHKRVVSFPADEAYVTAVGGTVLSLNSSGTRTGRTCCGRAPAAACRTSSASRPGSRALRRRPAPPAARCRTSRWRARRAPRSPRRCWPRSSGSPTSPPARTWA